MYYLISFGYICCVLFLLFPVIFLQNLFGISSSLNESFTWCFEYFVKESSELALLRIQSFGKVLCVCNSFTAKGMPRVYIAPQLNGKVVLLLVQVL